MSKPVKLRLKAIKGATEGWRPAWMDRRDAMESLPHETRKERTRTFDEWQHDYTQGEAKKIAHPFVVFPEDDGGFVACFPDLNGCITQAESDFEVMLMVRDAYHQYTESLIEDDQEIPQATDLDNWKAWTAS